MPYTNKSSKQKHQQYYITITLSSITIQGYILQHSKGDIILNFNKILKQKTRKNYNIEEELTSNTYKTIWWEPRNIPKYNTN